MSKIEINNEIVLMRQCVRRARVHILRKLVRQVKTLRLKKGDEKRQEKYKRKADKLAQELLAVKKVSEDEVSRFSITNTQSSEEILSDPKSDAERCVLARLSSHKIIVDRVAEFKLKYPNYEEHLKPGKRKMMKLRRKAAKQAKKKAKLMTEGEEIGNKDSIESSENRDSIASSDDEESESVRSRLEVHEGSIKETENNVSEDNLESSKPELKEGMVKNSGERLKSDREKRTAKSKSADKLSGICLTSKEATVKRFASFLEDKDRVKDPPVVGIENGSPEGSKMELEKEVDSFFVTENGDGEYLSVVVPKQNIPEDEETDETKPATWRQWNNSSDDGRGRGGRGGGRERGRGRGRGRGTSSARNERFFDKIGNIEEPNIGRSNKWKGEIRRDTSTRRNTDNSGPENVHPSWAAKKKQQEILKLGFQGKKVIFEDV